MQLSAVYDTQCAFKVKPSDQRSPGGSPVSSPKDGPIGAPEGIMSLPIKVEETA